ncbi:MAG: hypothetical protein F6K62_17565 [Sphaerospermopsis sp. SIO1G2]|nr:hypothetical protein [Sphaerospermopsis sp. SIO1G2]
MGVNWQIVFAVIGIVSGVVWLVSQKMLDIERQQQLKSEIRIQSELLDALIEKGYLSYHPRTGELVLQHSELKDQLHLFKKLYGVNDAKH